MFLISNCLVLEKIFFLLLFLNIGILFTSTKEINTLQKTGQNLLEQFSSPIIIVTSLGVNFSIWNNLLLIKPVS